MRQILFIAFTIFFGGQLFAQSMLNNIVINEIHYHNTEFIEFYNTSTTATIDISGWELIDNIRVRATIPAGTTIAPGGFHSEMFTSKYNQGGDQVILYDPNTNTYIVAVYQGFMFDPTIVTNLHPGATQVGSTENFGSNSTTNGISYQRSPDGSTNIIEDNTSMNVTNAVLPIELTFFEAKIKENATEIEWQTATEINNERFEIEHSTDGNNFEIIEILAGAGTSTETNNYAAIHNSPAKGSNYYRLKQVDFDGNFEYSKIVSTTIEINEDWKLFPTQSQSDITVEWSEDFSAKAVAIFDLNGKKVSEIAVNQDDTDVVVSTQNLPEGVYILNINDGRTFSSKPFFKVR